MQRVKSVLPARMCAAKICYHFTKSSPSSAYNLNIPKFCWNLFQVVSSSQEAKNHKAKTVVLQHMSIDSIQQCSKYFTKKNSIRCLSRNCLIENGLYSQHGLVPFGAHFSRSYSSVVSSKTDNIQHIPINDEKEALEKTTDSTVNGWNDIFNNAHQAVTGAVSYVENRAKEVSNEVTSQLQQLYDSYPYLENVIVPVGSTICATLLAWFVMPRILRKFHMYASRNPLALLYGHSIEEQIPYEKSVWSALEDPARYLFTFLAFYEVGIMIAPTTSQYLPQAWRGAVVLSVLWFLHRWKANVFARLMEKPPVFGLDRDKVLTLEKISTMGLLILGAIALAEACGVAVQSILTVGGIGGVATAFAARDILGNVLSGLSLQFSKPFSLGDNIKAGSIEGQVVEMGLTTTSLINPEKFPIIVPNSLFSSQVIVNKSRAELCACVMKIPMHIDDLEKVPNVAEEIKAMLSSNRRVSLEKELPYCFLSRIENSFLELTLGCNLKNMEKEDKHATQQDILVTAATIIKKHGAKLGGKFDDFYS